MLKYSGLFFSYSNWSIPSRLRKKLFSFTGMSFPYSQWQHSIAFAHSIPPLQFARVTRGIWLALPNSVVFESCSLHFVHSMLIPNAWGHTVRVQEIFVEPTTGPWLLYFSYSKASNERAIINKFNHSILLIKMKVKMLGESIHSSAPVFTASSAFGIYSRKLIVETHTLFFFRVTYQSHK